MKYENFIRSFEEYQEDAKVGLALVLDRQEYRSHSITGSNHWSNGFYTMNIESVNWELPLRVRMEVRWPR